MELLGEVCRSGVLVRRENVVGHGWMLRLLIRSDVLVRVVVVVGDGVMLYLRRRDRRSSVEGAVVLPRFWGRGR